jgi:hypothetical protein
MCNCCDEAGNSKALSQKILQKVLISSYEMLFLNWGSCYFLKTIFSSIDDYLHSSFRFFKEYYKENENSSMLPNLCKFLFIFSVVSLSENIVLYRNHVKIICTWILFFMIVVLYLFPCSIHLIFTGVHFFSNTISFNLENIFSKIFKTILSFLKWNN